MKKALPMHRLRVSDLDATATTPFLLEPDTARLKAMAADLALDGLRKLRFEGHLRAEGKTDWRLEARLGATVVQPCVVTLAPVTTRIEVPVIRRFLAHLPEDASDEDEVEMPEDETIDQLSAEIDLDVVMAEALALNLPLYPRAEEATLETARFTEPGKTPMSDEDMRPFAGLKALRDKLEDGE